MKRLPFKEFKSIYSRVPRVTIEVVLIKDGGVVLTYRNIEPYKGYWHVPGGTLFYKEKIADAVKRVAKDELGVNVEIEKLLGVWEIPEWKVKEGFTSVVGLVHQVNLVSGELKVNNQASEVKIFKTLPKNMIKEQRGLISKALRE